MSFNQPNPSELLKRLLQQSQQQQGQQPQYQVPASQASSAQLNALSSVISDYLKTHGALTSNTAARQLPSSDTLPGIQLSTVNSSVNQHLLALFNSMNSKTTQNMNPGQPAGTAASSASPLTLASLPLSGQHSNASAAVQHSQLSDILSWMNKELVADVLKKQAIYSQKCQLSQKNNGVQVSIETVYSAMKRLWTTYH